MNSRALLSVERLIQKNYHIVCKQYYFNIGESLNSRFKLLLHSSVFCVYIVFGRTYL